MFNVIAGTYDILNHLFSFGFDTYWRRQLAKALSPTCHALLDIATGTGDQLFDILAKHPDLSPLYGLDAADHMLTIARKKSHERGYSHRITWLHTTLDNAPFSNEQVDSITVSFGLRNFPHTEMALKKIWDLLKPGGELLILEFSLPRWRWLRFLYLIYLRTWIPWVGRLVSRHKEAYRYLNATIETFPYGKQLEALCLKAGFQECWSRPLTCGIVTLYKAKK